MFIAQTLRTLCNILTILYAFILVLLLITLIKRIKSRTKYCLFLYFIEFALFVLNISIAITSAIFQDFLYAFFEIIVSVFWYYNLKKTKNLYIEIFNDEIFQIVKEEFLKQSRQNSNKSIVIEGEFREITDDYDSFEN